MKKIFAMIITCFFLAVPLTALAEGDGGGGGGSRSGDGGGGGGERRGNAVLPTTPISGELDRLPKELTDGSTCGDYFAGSINNPEAPLTFALKRLAVDVAGKKTDVIIAFVMTKKNVVVVRDDKRKVPFAMVKTINGQKKVEVNASSAVMREAADCLPRPTKSRDV